MIIALPLHLHAQVAIEAMQAGKHVLTEKLMGHSIHECKEMGRVAKETGMLLATGHQRHYSILYDNAVDTIRRGLLGDIHHIRAQWHRGNLPGTIAGSRRCPTTNWQETRATRKNGRSRDARWPRSRPKSQAHEDDLKTQMPHRASCRCSDKDVEAAELRLPGEGAHAERQVVYTCSPLEELIRWRLWNRTGGGLMAELGSHQLDASSIFISAMYDERERVGKKSGQGHAADGHGRRRAAHLPATTATATTTSTACTSSRPATTGLRRSKIADPNKKIVVTYSSINGNGFGGYGEIVMGTEGHADPGARAGSHAVHERRARRPRSR